MPDLTRMQQDEDRKLRQKCREMREQGLRARIHNGVIVAESETLNVVNVQ
jgi:hypothetical protein